MINEYITRLTPALAMFNRAYRTRTINLHQQIQAKKIKKRQTLFLYILLFFYYSVLKIHRQSLYKSVFDYFEKVIRRLVYLFQKLTQAI